MGEYVINQHTGRVNNAATLLNPEYYKNTQIDNFRSAHMAIPLMFDGHANILLITLNDTFITVEHFEPHGPVYDPPEDEPMLTFNVEHKAIELISLLFNTTLDKINYLPPSAICLSYGIGPQWHLRNSTKWWGTCTFWSMLYAFKRLLMPDMPPTTTFNEIKEMAEKMEDNDDLIKATIEAFMK